MADFRRQINRLTDENTEPELINALAERLGTRTTSVNPLTEAMFAELRPETDPVEYARRSRSYSSDMSRVATNATGLKILLHEQVGRPLYAPVERLRKQDFAESIAAVDAFHDGQEAGMGIHTPTTLPLDVDGFVTEPPERSETPDSPFTVLADLTSGTEPHRLDFGDEPYHVYVLDCTPSVDDEPGKIWDRRRAVETKIESGISPAQLEPKEQATHALNQGRRVYYIGSTNDVRKRIRAHLSGTDKSGVNFTNTLPPRFLVGVRGCDSRVRADALEGAVTRELNRRAGVFAYSDRV
jgi:predicted GIY-YIG superfamily endonuclease